MIAGVTIPEFGGYISRTFRMLPNVHKETKKPTIYPKFSDHGVLTLDSEIKFKNIPRLTQVFSERRN